MSLLQYLKTSFSTTCKYLLVVYSNLKVTNTWYVVHVQYVCCTQVLFDLFGYVVVWDVIEQGITVSVAAFMKMVLPEQYILPLVDQLHVHAHMYSTFCAVLSHVEHFYKSTVHVPS